MCTDEANERSTCENRPIVAWGEKRIVITWEYMSYGTEGALEDWYFVLQIRLVPLPEGMKSAMGMTRDQLEIVVFGESISIYLILVTWKWGTNL